MPLPKFRLRQVATTARIWDGQTLMLSAGTSRQTERTRTVLSPAETSKGAKGGAVYSMNAVGYVNKTTEKELFFFITPTLIDPAGNPLHSPEDLPFHQRPPEQKPR